MEVFVHQTDKIPHFLPHSKEDLDVYTYIIFFPKIIPFTTLNASKKMKHANLPKNETSKKTKLGKYFHPLP